MQSVEPISDSDEDQVPEDLGKLTKLDKARIGRVRSKVLKPDKLTTYS